LNARAVGRACKIIARRLGRIGDHLRGLAFRRQQGDGGTVVIGRDHRAVAGAPVATGRGPRSRGSHHADR
jgi:hypothetical protein